MKTTYVYSFGRKWRVDPPVTHLIDVTEFDNPHHSSVMAPLDGTYIIVQEFLLSDPEFESMLRFTAEKVRQGDSVAFRCVGGKHRSVAAAELLAERIANIGPVKVVHLEKDKWNR